MDVSFANVVGKHVTFLGCEDGKHINGLVKSVLKDNGSYFYEVQTESRTTLLPVRLYEIVAISIDPHLVGREFKSQEDFYLPVTQQKIKLDPNVTVKLYDLLADNCTDEKGYTDLPAMIAYLSNLIIMFTKDVKRDMGEDVCDEVVTLLHSMLPECIADQEKRETISQQVFEVREENGL